MDFWDSPHAGVFIGAIGVVIGSTIAGAFSILGQVLSNQRQKKGFAHDLQLRKEQFAHERDLANRDRRMAALDDLQLLLDEQAIALGDLWGYLLDPSLRPYITLSPAEAWKVLREKNYRRRLWPINLPLSRAINVYSEKMEALFRFLNQQDIADLCAGRIHQLDENTFFSVNPNFKAATTPLSAARKEVINLMSELNHIQVIKTT